MRTDGDYIETILCNRTRIYCGDEKGRVIFLTLFMLMRKVKIIE